LNTEGVAGSIGQDGYWFITICGKRYAASRLAWFYVYGEWPKNVIDHKDHDITSNSIANLRDISCAENSQNQVKPHKDSSTGFLGVRFHAHKNLYQARIQTGGKRIALGCYKTAEEAHEAYVSAKRNLHSTCTI